MFMNEPSSDDRIKIQHRTKKQVTLRRLSVDQSSIDHWNLCPLVLERHPLHNDKSKVEKLSCTYLVVRLSGTEQRNLFYKSLKVLSSQRKLQEEKLSQCRHTARVLETRGAPSVRNLNSSCSSRSLQPSRVRSRDS